MAGNLTDLQQHSIPYENVLLLPREEFPLPLTVAFAVERIFSRPLLWVPTIALLAVFLSGVLPYVKTRFHADILPFLFSDPFPAKQYNGSQGVELALKLLLHEFTIAMGLTG